MSLGRGFQPIVLLLPALLTAGCSGSSEEGTPIDPNPTSEYVLVIAPASISIPAGGRDSVRLSIGRVGDFTGAVATSLLNPPAGVTATFNPAITAGSSFTQAWVSLNVAANVTPATYPVVIRGSVTGQQDRTTTLQLTVTPGTGTGNVTVNLSGCLPRRVLWVAAQDGNTPWARLTGANDVYRFNVTSGTGAFAWISEQGNAHTLHMRYATQAELTAATTTPCTARGTRRISGSTTGLASNEFGIVSLGGGLVSTFGAQAAFTLPDVRDGVHDLVAYSFAGLDARAQRAIIRRDVNTTSLSSLPALSFAPGGESFATVPAVVTVQNHLNQPLYLYSTYHTGPACDAAQFGILSAPNTGGGIVLGMPPSQQRDGDFHQLAVTTQSAGVTNANLFLDMLDIPGSPGFRNPVAGRTMRVFYRNHVDRAVTLGAPLTEVTVTKVGGPYKRLRAVFTIPPQDYQTSATFEYGTLGNGPQVTVTATRDWLGGAAASIEIPDLSGVAGWNTGWPPTFDGEVRWAVTVLGTNITTTQCAEGAYIRTSRVVGGIS